MASLVLGQLGAGLFDRRAGRIQVTDVGQRLYEYAQQILQLHEQARSELVGFSPHSSPELALAASTPSTPRVQTPSVFGCINARDII